MLNLTLPWPPSTNKLWRHVMIAGKPRTLLSREGRAYFETVGYRVLVLRQRLRGEIPPCGLKGTLKVTIVAHPPDNRRRDLDNVLKATLDALTKARVWEDDFQIDWLTITRGERRDGGALDVTIEEVTP